MKDFLNLPIVSFCCEIMKSFKNWFIKNINELRKKDCSAISPKRAKIMALSTCIVYDKDIQKMVNSWFNVSRRLI